MFREQRDDGTWRAYDISGRVFREPNGSCWTGSLNENMSSTVDVEFPYVPKTEYVDVEEDWLDA